MQRPVDRPLARANAHLQAGRLPSAIGAYRAAVAVDANEIRAHLGLANALAARGDRERAADGLVAAAERFSEADRDDEALRLYGQALTIEPTRHELHLDIAVLEWGMGRIDAASARAESLADMYMGMGRTEEAADVLRFFASLDEEDQAEDDVPMLSAEPMLSTETVVCATVLIRPDGSLYLADPKSAAAPVGRKTTVASASATQQETVAEPEADMITLVSRRPTATTTKRVATPPIERPPIGVPPSQVVTLPPTQRNGETGSARLRLHRAPRPSSVPTLPPTQRATTTKSAPPKPPAPRAKAPTPTTAKPVRAKAPTSTAAEPAPRAKAPMPTAAKPVLRAKAPTSTTAKPAPRPARSPRSVPPPPTKRARPAAAAPRSVPKAPTQPIRPSTIASLTADGRAVRSPSKPRAPLGPKPSPRLSPTKAASPTTPRPARPTGHTATARSEVRRIPKAETTPITVHRGPQKRSALAQRLLDRAAGRRPAVSHAAAHTSEPAPIPPLADDEITRCFRRSELR